MKIEMNADRNANNVIIIAKDNPCVNHFAARYIIGGETETRRAEGKTWEAVIEEIETIVNFKLANADKNEEVQPRKVNVNGRNILFFA
jgi:hypothetical protein